MLFIGTLKQFYKKYERFLIPGLLLVGVIVDVVTFRSISLRSTCILLVIYLAIAGACIAFIHTKSRWRYLAVIAPLVLQFVLGNLLSSSLVFYWFSGAFSISWPILTLIALLMAFNEVLREYYERLTVQVGVLYFVLLSCMSLILPVFFSSIDVWVFVLGGAISTVLIAIYIVFLTRLLGDVAVDRPRLAVIVIAILATLNALYFLDVIPPIPLSLREADVYHDVKRVEDGYDVLTEPEPWWDSLSPGKTIHLVEGDSVYVFTAIFAPAELSTRIVHDWQYYDEAAREWVQDDVLSFPINGGRSQGYRGYTQKNSLRPGKWRVDVQTSRGQTLGRVTFEVEIVDVEPELETIKL